MSEEGAHPPSVPVLLPPDLIAEHVVDAALFSGRCDPHHHDLVAILIAADPMALALRDTLITRLAHLLDGAANSAAHFEHLSGKAVRTIRRGTRGAS